ncbi:hypothetical protein QNA23_07025 [Rhodococcus erythropolis]|uniref:hypothetical protein n=1 Tax=Rhodococcus erythropolis TaxID=1833 RepID=UPI0024BAFEAD|nr:hypothetical protein [Rhodococcus erythropolis]MDJ0403225.1 hypothetical protein [Rhodococcus erythropolis]
MTMQLATGDLTRLTTAIKELDPQPRERRWSSLTFCILDAVWSIQANYKTTVVPLVERVAATLDISNPSVAASTVCIDPLPINRFLEEFDIIRLLETTNKQRTSTRGGITKAQAVLEHGQALQKHGVETIDQAQLLFENPGHFRAVNADLRHIKGEGAHGIRRSYFWMLVGDHDRVKPDRMVLRWFKHHGHTFNPAEAAETIAVVVDRINSEVPARKLTAWEVDHALWKSGRDL